MPRKISASFRLSSECLCQLSALAQAQGRSQATVIEIAIEQLYHGRLPLRTHHCPAAADEIVLPAGSPCPDCGWGKAPAAG